jgi:hypothetical protein
VGREHKWDNYTCSDVEGKFLFESSTQDKWEACDELWEFNFNS